MPRPRHLRFVPIAVLICLLGAGGSASAAPVLPADAMQAAEALSTQSGLVTGASWVLRPTDPSNGGAPGRTVAIAEGPLLGFPTSGSKFAVFSSGNALQAETPSAVGHKDTQYVNAPGTEAHNEGAGSANDLTILHVAIQVPAKANCLALDFRFLSQEYPRYVGEYDDGFLVELDQNNWKIRNDNASFDAPANFATDAEGNPLSVNSTGSLSLSHAGAEGSGFAGTFGPENKPDGGGTALLSAETLVTPGVHDLYLSVFDARDHVYDSGAFVGHLRAFKAVACPRGAVTAGEAAAPAPPIGAGPPQISGPPVANEVLTSTPGTWTGEELLFTYQWLLDGAPIEGATNPTYTVTPADEGHELSVTVTATNEGGKASQTSAPTTIGRPEVHQPVTSAVAAASALLAPGTPAPVHACRSARSETIHWKVVHHVRLRSITLTLNGALYKRLRGSARHATISFAERGPGQVLLKIAGVGRSGRRYSATRLYHPCAHGKLHGTLKSQYLTRG